MILSFNCGFKMWINSSSIFLIGFQSNICIGFERTSFFFSFLFFDFCRFFTRRKINFTKFYFSFYCWIPMIFYTIISTTRNVLRYNSPFITKLLMSFNKNLVFFFSPFIFFNIRIKMIMPTFSTLFTNSFSKILCNLTPISRTIFWH